jgi:hypothetical protein
MTSNEIRSEFEAWDDLRCYPAITREPAWFAYLAAAQTREKRIAELEKDVADSASAISAIHQLRMDAEKRIAELAAERDEWRTIEYLWGCGMVELRCNSDGRFIAECTHAEGRAEYYRGDTPEQTIDDAMREEKP